ncbi:hypothetical protein TNCV_3341131 [Trichonephila clavipes]|nr:hypothetical protein TNCV_3341131 [Trichonephila clavipes]
MSEVARQRILNILRCSRESIRKQRLNLWGGLSWVVLYDNALTHHSLLVNDILEKTPITILPHPPYSPYPTPCDFSLFSKLARHLQGPRFQSADEVKKASRAALKDMAKKCIPEMF